MDDIIAIVIKHLEEEYGAKNCAFIFGYKLNIEPKVAFTLPNYNLVFQFRAQELIDANDKVGEEYVLKMIDRGLMKALIDIRKRFPEGFD